MARRLSSIVVRQIKQLAGQGCASREIARHVGLSLSTIHKVRQGKYDARLSEPVRSCQAAADEEPDLQAVWCEVCRCHVYPPCQTCRMKAYADRQRTSTRRKRPLPAELANDPRLEIAVAELGLPLRMVNYLEQRGILTVCDLLHCQAAKLRQAPNFGDKSLRLIFAALKRLGFVRDEANAAS